VQVLVRVARKDMGGEIQNVRLLVFRIGIAASAMSAFES